MRVEASDWACGLAVLILGLGVKLYSVVEILTTSAIFLSFGLPPGVASMIWDAAKRQPRWTRVASRNPNLMTCQTAELLRPRVID
jgi:hypothetical protein